MAETARPLDALPLPRRAAIAELLGAALELERGLAVLYAGFAASGDPPPLAAAVAELAAARTARVERLEALDRALAVNGSRAPAPAEARAAAARGPLTRPELFARAFTAERDLGFVYHELLALLEPAGPLPALADLAAGAASLHQRLRRIYLRYS